MNYELLLNNKKGGYSVILKMSFEVLLATISACICSFIIEILSSIFLSYCVSATQKKT